MRTKRFLILVTMVIGILTILVSCEDDESDTEKPTITMGEPSSNDTIPVGAEEVHIEFVAADNDKLQGLTVTVTSPADSSILSNSPNVAGLKSYNFHQHITPAASSIIQLTLIVTATDASNNRTSTTVLFHIVP